MQMSLSQFSTKIEADKLPTDVFVVTPLQFQQYENGELVFELSAHEGRLVTTGKLTANGDSQIRVVDNEAAPEYRLATLRTERLIAFASRAGGTPFDALAVESKFERVELPGQVEVNSRGHQLLGRAFQFDANNFKLISHEPVQVVGPGRRMEARGLESDLRSKSFKFLGPVKGTENPSAQRDKLHPGVKLDDRKQPRSGKEK